MTYSKCNTRSNIIVLVTEDTQKPLEPGQMELLRDAIKYNRTVKLLDLTSVLDEVA